MNIPILSFNSGELSLLIDARSDVEKYSSGCRHLDNFIPRIYGGVERRPGTRYVASQYDTTEPVIRIIPFIFSSEVAYSIEFGDQYLRPFSTVTLNGEIVFNKGSEVILSCIAVTTPYLAADLFALHIKQLGDTMWITHRNYAQNKLRRTSPTTFSLDEVVFKKGPFLLRNDLIDPNMTDTALMELATISDDYQLTGDDISYEFSGDAFRAQMFLAITTTSVTSIRCKMNKGVGDSPGNIVVGIWPTTSNNPATGKPTSVDGHASAGAAYINGSYGTYDGNAITETATGDWYNFAFSAPVQITAGTLYAIVPKALSASTYEIYWRYNSTGNIYTNGRSASTTDGGLNWGLLTSTFDFMFQLVETVFVANGVSCEGTLTCHDDESTPNMVSFFEEGHIGSLFKLTYPRVTKVSKCTLPKSKYAHPDIVYGVDEPYVICAPIDVKGTFRFVTHGRWDGTIELQRNENGAGWETVEIWVGDKDTNAQIAKVEDADNVQYRAILTEFTRGEGLYIRADITVSSDTQDVIVRVTAINSVSEAQVESISGGIVTGATRRWAEGAWSPLRGYPDSITFFEDRCCYVGMYDIQTQVMFDNATGHIEPKLPKTWLSYSGDYENFEANVKDADSFELTIPSTDDVAWIDAVEYLMVGTYGNEWRIGSNKMEQPITPTNFSVREQSSYGSNGIQPISAGESMLFVSGRRLMEEIYSANDSKNKAVDLTVLAEHITLSGIVDISVQYDPDQIVWCVLSDGSLIAMVYERNQNVVAWFKCPIDGKVQSVCVIPGPDEDEVWISIKRNINGADCIYIEKFAPRNFGTSVSDAYFVDCGLTYTLSENVIYGDDNVYYEGYRVLSGDTFSTVTGLSHLNGETVKVVGDGIILDDAFVASGQITLKLGGVITPVQKAQVGLPYRSKLQPMRIITGTPQGSSQGMITRVPRMSISFLNSMDTQYGASDDNLKDINWDDPQWENSEDSIAGLFTGEVTVSVDGGFSVQNPIIISTDAPLPCVIRSIMPRLEVSGE